MGDVANHGIGSQFDPITAKKSKDGFWRDINNNLPKVSASDIERHTYCPLSWELAKKGNPGQGDAINSGKVKHAEIHEKVSEFKIKQSQFKRHMIIWTWWFTVIIAIVIDSIACLLYTSPSPRDRTRARMPSSA